MYKISLLFLLLVSVSTYSQAVTNVFEKNGQIFLQLDNGLLKIVPSEKNVSMLLFARTGQFVLFQKVLKKSRLKESSDIADQYRIYLYDIKSNQTNEIFTSCLDGKGGTSLSYSNTSIYPFTSICNPSKFLLSSDETKIFFESTAWAVSGAVHYYNITQRKIYFFHSGSLLKTSTKGVEIQVTEIEMTKKKGNDESNGRYWQNRLFDYSGKFIKATGPKEF